MVGSPAARFKSKLQLSGGVGFSKLLVSSMLGLFVVCRHKHRFTEETDMDCQATSHFSVRQCDFTSTTGPGWPSPAHIDVSCPAKRLLPQQRQDLATQVLAGTETVSDSCRRCEMLLHCTERLSNRVASGATSASGRRLAH